MGLPTAFPDNNISGHDNRRCDDFCSWYGVCLEQMSIVRMVVRRRISEEVYTGRFERLFV